MKKEVVDKLYTGGLVLVAGLLLSNQISSFNNKAEVVEATTQNYAQGQQGNNKQAQYDEAWLFEDEDSYAVDARIEDGVQVFEFDLQPNSYPSLNINPNMPVRLIINADSNSLNSCNYVIASLDIGFQKQLDYGENILDFTVDREGEFIYTCWMSMLGATITASEDIETPSAEYLGNVATSGCCSF